MTDAPNNSSYILVNNDSVDLPNSRVLVAGTNFELDDTGTTITIDPRDNLLNLTTFTAGGPGYVTYESSGGSFGTVPFSSNGTININNSIGVGGGNSFSVIQDTSFQRINVQLDNLLLSTRSDLNIIAGGDSSITVVDNPVLKRTDITIGLPGIITPADATFILQKEDSTLPNAQALDLLATGIVKNTTASGVLSIAVPDTDYQSASINLTQISSLTHNVGDTIFYYGTTYASLSAGGLGTIFSVHGGAVNFPAWQNLAGEGSVTSVGMVCTDGTMILAGSPVTGSGNIGMILTNIVSPGTHNLANISVDLHGRITAISDGIVSGTVSSFGLTAPVARFTLGGTNPITTSGNITADLLTTSVVAGDYVNAHLTIDAYGRITKAEEGNLVWSFTEPLGNSVTPYPNHGYVTQSSSGLVFATWGLFNDTIVGDEFYFCVDIAAPFAVRTSGGQVYGPAPLPGSFGILTMSPGSSVHLVCTVPSPSRTFQVLSYTGPISIA